MQTSPFITIFTPTYNRAALLPRLYNSLTKLNTSTFEWIIVDDGSTDHTESLVQSFQKDGQLDISYYRQPNSGKHIAINKGVELARGELFFIVDSDDFLPTNSLEIVNKHYQKIKDKSNIAGVCGKRMLWNENCKNLVLNNKEEFCTPFEFRFVKKYEGDMAEVLKTKILKNYPFPQFKGEKFCTEALIWNRIGKDYKLLYFDEFIYECEYQDGGLTSQYWQLLLDNPAGSLLYYKELLGFPLDKQQRHEVLRIYNGIAKGNGYSIIKIVKELGLHNFLNIYLP